MTPAQRKELGLDIDDGPAPIHTLMPPSSPGEFDGRHNATTVSPARTPNLKLILSATDKANAPRIRQMVNELLAGNMDNADYAMKQLFAANPKVAIELFLEMAQFTLPKLKAVHVDVNDGGASPRAMTYQQLMQAMTDV